MTLLSPVTAQFWDNNSKAVAQGSGGNAAFGRNGHAWLRIQTTADSDGSMTITGVPNATNYVWDSCLSLWVDGAFHQSVPFNRFNLGVSQSIVVRGLPTGSHVIDIETPALTGTAPGFGLQTVTVTGSLVSPTAPTRRLVIYGDSILAQGWNGGDPQGGLQGRALSASMRLRHGSRFGGVTCLGVCGLAAFTVMQNSGTRSTWVSEVQTALDGTTENVLLYALGTNDWSGAAWNAASYQTGLGAAIDALHTASPATTVKLCSMFVTSTSGVNGAGSTKADYDTATQAVATARSGYCTFIDASGFAVIGDLSTWGGDGAIHPGNTGHLGIYTGLNAVL